MDQSQIHSRPNFPSQSTSLALTGWLLTSPHCRCRGGLPVWHSSAKGGGFTYLGGQSLHWTVLVFRGRALPTSALTSLLGCFWLTSSDFQFTMSNPDCSSSYLHVGNDVSVLHLQVSSAHRVPLVRFLRASQPEGINLRSGMVWSWKPGVISFPEENRNLNTLWLVTQCSQYESTRDFHANTYLRGKMNFSGQDAGWPLRGAIALSTFPFQGLQGFTSKKSFKTFPALTIQFVETVHLLQI